MLPRQYITQMPLIPVDFYSFGTEIQFVIDVAVAEPGRLAFIAGQVALDGDGNLVGPNDAAAQFPQVFANLKTILDGIGAGFSDVVELTTYLVGEDSRQPWEVGA